MALQNMKIRSQLLLFGGITIAGFIVFGITAFHAMNKIKVRGPIYTSIVQGKDLIADILPPPEYIIESYLTVLQAVDESNPGTQRSLMDKFSQLHKDYDTRHEFWHKDLAEGPMKDLLLKNSYEPAIAFYEKAERDFFPAVLANDKDRAKTVMADLKNKYESHRQAIDELVKMANERNSEDEVFADKTIRNKSVLLVIIMCLTVAASGIVAYMIIGNLLQQVGGEPRYLAEAAQKISGGDLTVRFDDSKGMTGINASMASMLKGLKDLVNSIKENSDTIASAGVQLSASAEEMSQGVSEQSGRATQIASAATQMSQTVTDVAQNTSSIATAASETSQLAKDGKKVVNQSMTESEGIARVVNEFSDKIGTLGDKSKQIGEIVNVINDIAGQTNLLALNAAIEAARAGDQGRGFAVVADEVRKLAERTSKATSEIGAMISAIQNEIGTVVDSMGETTIRVQKGVELSSHAGNALDNIVRSIEELQGKVQHIAGSTVEMSSASDSISTDIENIARVSEEASASSHQVAQSSSDLARMASDLQSIVTRFRI